jgi:hypothetical protein
MGWANAVLDAVVGAQQQPTFLSKLTTEYGTGACSASYTAPYHPLSVRLRVKEATVEVIEGPQKLKKRRLDFGRSVS